MTGRCRGGPGAAFGEEPTEGGCWGGGGGSRKKSNARQPHCPTCGLWTLGIAKKGLGAGAPEGGGWGGGGGSGDRAFTEGQSKGWRWLRNQGPKRRIRRCFEKTFPDDVCLKMISASRGSRDPVTPPPTSHDPRPPIP